MRLRLAGNVGHRWTNEGNSGLRFGAFGCNLVRLQLATPHQGHAQAGTEARSPGLATAARTRLRRLALLIVPIAALPLLWTWIASRMTSHGQSLHTWSLILGAGIITALYAGSPGLRGRRFALRRMPGLKMIWIGGAWAVLTAIWPVWWKALEANLPLPDSTWNLALERFLVIAALTLPFDLRDRDWDAADMRTWPQLLGTAGTRLLGVTLLCGAWALRTTSLHQPWTAGIGLLPMVAMVALARENRPAGYFVALDALLMVDALWLVLS